MTPRNEYIRKMIPRQNHPEPVVSVGKKRIVHLLDEYDALLATVPFARHKKECQIARAWGNGPGGTFTDPHCNCGFENALAALPERLKEKVGLK